jgi:hypothetical protein
MLVAGWLFLFAPVIALVAIVTVWMEVIRPAIERAVGL